MKILFADDNEIHRNFFTSTINEVQDQFGHKFEILKICEDGDELVTAYDEFKDQGVDCVFSDIRMPNLDGLSALIKILHKNPNQKFVMVSSEDVQKMTMMAHQHATSSNIDVDLEKKFQLVDKIVERLKTGQIEPGKINGMLEGCEKLALDPVLAAQHYGASGYVRKPYMADKFNTLVEQLSTATEFILAN